MGSHTITTIVLLAGFLLVATKLEATPAYARKHQLACSMCHSAWPLINKFGRTFKENGYRLDREPAVVDPASTDPADDITIDENLGLNRVLPLSFRIQGRPVAKRNTDSRFDMQVAHEFELQVTGSAPGNLSYYANIEAADDADWAAELADLVAGWHPKAQANIVGGFGPMTFVDPYNTFSSRRLTQDRPSPNGSGFQSAYRIRDPGQFVSFYGRAGGLFYSATVGTGNNDFLGADLKDYVVRAAYDLPGGASIGAFSFIGERELTAPVRVQDYTRSGVDVQIDTNGFTANAVWYRAKEDLAATLVEQENDAWYVQALYTTPTKIPIVPVVRLESVESGNGQARTTQLALALVGYVRGNINVSLDYTKQLKVPGTAAKTNRFSILCIVGM
ncbi:MAG: hypothetical protein WC815_17975 [Vicinamibacterales bacterium]|jgi:hypothetical protein